MGGVRRGAGYGGVAEQLWLCPSPIIKKFKVLFGNHIVTISLSQFPNLKGLLETTREKIVRRKKLELQNLEDADRELLRQAKPTKPTLMVLDDEGIFRDYEGEDCSEEKT